MITDINNFRGNPVNVITSAHPWERFMFYESSGQNISEMDISEQDANSLMNVIIYIYILIT